MEKKNQKSCTLVINNRKDFDQDVWQIDSYLLNNQDYEQWFQAAKWHLKIIYEEYSELQEKDSKADPYILGDIINMLNVMNVKIKK